MSNKFFGTDGVRGRVGEEPLTADFALRLANAAARATGLSRGTVVIGKDTRLSGYMFESALEAGFVSAGFDVLMTGPLPTPGIAFLTQKFGADMGVVISASHNQYFDNGIKFFDGAGAKLSDETEAKIERMTLEGAITRDSAELGKAKRIDSARGQYEEFLRASFPTDLNLEGLKLVVDCAHGATYKVAPRVLSELGAEIIPIGCSPNGRNINAACGSTHPELLQTTVRGVGADLGLALDGDGDRVVMVDHEGNVVDGDQLLYMLALGRQRDGLLKGPVVGTVMTNLGLERKLQSLGIEFMRSKVGDRHVLEMLREHGGILGGEASGHILCLDKATTGDGVLSALEVLAEVKRTGKRLAELVSDMPRYPQLMINVKISGKIDLDGHEGIQAARREVEAGLGDRGRVVLRASGTEPLIRVMVEGESQEEVEQAAQALAEQVRSLA
jgi:phosphoglucosamine mutase